MNARSSVKVLADGCSERNELAGSAPAAKGGACEYS